MSNLKKVPGFTLIELMIVVAIIAILSAIAYPSYQKYVIRGSREAAKTELLQLHNAQEKIFLNSNAYTTSVTGAYTGQSNGGLGITSGSTSDGKYALSITQPGGTQTYTLTATPVAASTQVGDGNIVAASDGTRTWGTATW